jgi:hypothetical protein
MGGTSSSGAAASGLSQLGVAGSVAGALIGARGTKNADDYKAAMLEQAAQYGDLKATQTNAQMTRNLSITLGHIDAVRAAARTDPTSPTGAAVRDYTETVGTEDKNIKVDSILAQSQMDEENAAYMRQAGSDALLAGDINAGAGIVKAIGQGLTGMPSGGGGGPSDAVLSEYDQGARVGGGP